MSNNYTFEKLPETFDYHDGDFVLTYNETTPITGNPATILKQYKLENDENNPDGGNPDGGNPDENNQENNNEPVDPDDSIDNVKKEEVIKEDYTELMKVSYIVRNIDYDTNIVPQGAYKVIPEHELRLNETFKGLPEKELKNLKMYHHFRPITQNKSIIESDDAIFRYDFLDCIENDKVRGCWSAQLDSTKKIVSNIYLYIWKVF